MTVETQEPAPATRAAHHEIRSEAVQDIIGYVPHWIVRWGNSAVFGAIALLLFLSWFIRYPEQLTTRIHLTSQFPTERVIAHANGKIARLFVQDGDAVETGRRLAVIASTANVDDALKLADSIASIHDPLELERQHSVLRRGLVLGQVQDDHLHFLRAADEYYRFVEIGFHSARIAALEQQIGSTERLNERLKRQRDILQEELSISTDVHQTNQQLFEDETISASELSESKTAVLRKRYDRETIDITIINNEIQLQDYRQSVLDLKREQADTQSQLVGNFRETLRSLQSSILAWQDRHVLIAGMSGTVSFFRYWKTNQYVTLGEEVMTIVPVEGESNTILGRMELPSAGAGRLSLGQRVKVKFDDYPFTEFGAVFGAVSAISQIPRENHYLVLVEFSDGLRFSYKRDLEFRQDMEGTAEVVTHDLRLIQRVFNVLRSLFDQVNP